jgi:methylated-DNA-[protein]-cysteine S-methyltransferase
MLIRRIDSPIGLLTLIALDDALVGLSWDEGIADDAAVVSGGGQHESRVLEQTVRELDEYFHGTRRTFDVTVAASGTTFQQAAWSALRTIPYGETISYGEQAQRMGRRTAVRAVGGANGRNPVGIIVPCHRVIGADGSLTGFGGGLAAKAWLLGHERAVLARS